MIKFIVAALWISAVTAGSVYYSFQSAHSKVSNEPAPPYLGGLDYVKTDVISVPVMSRGEVHGYFLARLVYTVKPEELKKLSIPAAPLISDQVYTYLYANPQIDFSKKDNLDLDAFRASLRDGLNQRLGTDLVHDVIVEQIDFLSKEDIRDNTLRRRQRPARATDASPAVEQGEPAASAH